MECVQEEQGGGEGKRCVLASTLAQPDGQARMRTHTHYCTHARMHRHMHTSTHTRTHTYACARTHLLRAAPELPPKAARQPPAHASLVLPGSGRGTKASIGSNLVICLARSESSASLHTHAHTQSLRAWLHTRGEKEGVCVVQTHLGSSTQAGRLRQSALTVLQAVQRE